MPRVKPDRLYSPSQLIERLARIHDVTHPDGRPNYSAMSRRTGIPIATIARIHRGRRDSNSDATRDRMDTWVLSNDTTQRLMSAFGLTFAEASGQVEIPEGRSRGKTRSPREPTASDMELLDKLRSLPTHRQHEVRAFLEAQARLESSREK